MASMLIKPFVHIVRLVSEGTLSKKVIHVLPTRSSESSLDVKRHKTD